VPPALAFAGADLYLLAPFDDCAVPIV